MVGSHFYIFFGLNCFKSRQYFSAISRLPIRLVLQLLKPVSNAKQGQNNDNNDNKRTYALKHHTNRSHLAGLKSTGGNKLVNIPFFKVFSTLHEPSIELTGNVFIIISTFLPNCKSFRKCFHS